MKIEKHNELTEAKNRRFAKASKARKRVMIARDVLAQLGTRMIAKHRVWVEDPEVLKKEKLRSFVNAPSATTEVCDVTSKLKTCNVCGIGALFVSAVEFADKLKIRDLDNYYTNDVHVQFSSTDLWKYLGKYFTEDQLNMIECAFEGGEGQVSVYTAHNSHLFLSNLDIDDPNERMRLIMENIVVNKGTFIPTILPVEKVIHVTPGFKG